MRRLLLLAVLPAVLAPSAQADVRRPFTLSVKAKMEARYDKRVDVRTATCDWHPDRYRVMCELQMRPESGPATVVKFFRRSGRCGLYVRTMQFYFDGTIKSRTESWPGGYCFFQSL